MGSIGSCSTVPREDEYTDRVCRVRHICTKEFGSKAAELAEPNGLRRCAAVRIPAHTPRCMSNEDGLRPVEAYILRRAHDRPPEL